MSLRKQAGSRRNKRGKFVPQRESDLAPAEYIMSADGRYKCIGGTYSVPDRIRYPEHHLRYADITTIFPKLNTRAGA